MRLVFPVHGTFREELICARKRRYGVTMTSDDPSQQHLKLSLPTSLPDAIDAAVRIWAESTNAGALSPQTLDKLTSIADRFQRFAAVHRIATLDDVTPDLIKKFIVARGRNRCGLVSRTAVATMHNRRATLRALYQTARREGLTLNDPTSDIILPARTASSRRPVSEDEAALIRMACQHGPSTRHAVTAALLLAGAHTSELGHITAADVGLHAAHVQAHGSAKHRARRLPLDTWTIRIITERVCYLSNPLPEGHQSPVLCTAATGSDAHKQARVCVTVREILTWAGLSDDLSIRPSSLTAYAARRVFDRTGRVEAAAALIGSRSLDSTAALIGYQWVAGDV